MSFKIEDLLPGDIPEPKTPFGMRLFTMARTHDQSGVSGTGPVVQGVLMATGEVVVQWNQPVPLGDIQIKRSMEAFLKIHVHEHPENKTIITWGDGTQDFYPPESAPDYKAPAQITEEETEAIEEE